MCRHPLPVFFDAAVEERSGVCVHDAGPVCPDTGGELVRLGAGGAELRHRRAALFGRLAAGRWTGALASADRRRFFGGWRRWRKTAHATTRPGRKLRFAGRRLCKLGRFARTHRRVRAAAYVFGRRTRERRCRVARRVAVGAAGPLL